MRVAAVRYTWSWLSCSALAACSSADGASAPGFNADASAGAGGATTSSGGGGGISGGQANGGAAGAGGGNSTAGSASIDPMASERAACRAYLQAACQRVEECGGTLSCSSLLKLCPDYFFSPGSTRTLAGVAACAREWATLPCGDVYEGGAPACATPGTRKAGDPCLFPNQCESLGCSADASDPRQCGTCRPLATAGGSCNDATECPPLQYCASGTCASASPKDPLPPPGGPGDPCSSRCVPGYTCQNVAGTLHCAPPPGPGSSCAGTYTCSAGAYCNTSDVCIATPGSGEACGLAAQSGAQCAVGTICDNDTVRCIPRVPLGGICRIAYKECIEGADCSSVPGPAGQPVVYRCFRTIEEGEACTGANDRCVAATTCQGGRCVASGDLGLFSAACGP